MPRLRSCKTKGFSDGDDVSSFTFQQDVAAICGLEQPRAGVGLVGWPLRLFEWIASAHARLLVAMSCVEVVFFIEHLRRARQF
jgi:hypothetical protein